MDLDDLITFIIESGFDINEVIEELEDYLADNEETYWTDEDLDYEVDSEGFHSLR